jgi:hypothetical protein
MGVDVGGATVVVERRRIDAMSVERCEWHLDNWAEWMGRRQSLAYGWPSRASGLIGKSNSTDFDTMVHAADVRCAVAVDVLVDDLPPSQRAAIYAVKLATDWDFRWPLQEVYEMALGNIARALGQRGIM